MELNPQQTLFLASYTNPKSETFGNALQSALKAGYTKEYSENITALMPDWLLENIGKTKLVQKAEKNLEKALDGGLDDAKKGKKEIQWKATEMTLKTLRKEDYSERTEVTGKGGASLNINIINFNGDNSTPSI